MKSATLVFLIDLQNGFARNDLTPEQGGNLYVPGGENVGKPAAKLIRAMSGATIVLSQDFHPKNQISFASNHPGAEPFSAIGLKRVENNAYEIARNGEEGILLQTLWPDHCIQETESMLFVDPLMDELPCSLKQDVNTSSCEVLMDEDNRGNRFYVIRKGVHSDLDSHGIATENDQIRTTQAPAVFEGIADRLCALGHKDANIYIGGLATNYCVEFSHSDVYKFMVPALRARDIATNVYLLTDVCAGIRVSTPDGSWPDAAASFDRMGAFGTRLTTTGSVIRLAMKENGIKHTGQGPAL